MIDSSGAVESSSKSQEGKLLGFSDDVAAELVAYKEAGNKFKDHPEGSPKTSLELVSAYAQPGYIIVDCSAAQTDDVLAIASSKGAGIATANKKPMTGSLNNWQVMTSATNLPRTKYESTVGAGTPMIACLHRLLNAGDEVRKVQGALSGTLGYLMSGLEEGKKFSQVVNEAYKLGYTEPEPRDDLGGMDVARKALIIGRVS